MSAPTYVTKKVGNDLVLIRSDSNEMLVRMGSIVGGAYLVLKAMQRGGLVSTAAVVTGAALVYRGWTGRSVLDLFGRSDVAQSGAACDTPSYRDEGMSSGQMPADAVDEAAMGSFPASDPPAMSREASPVNPQ